MSSFLSRLHSQYSQALVFRPYPDSPPYKRPRYSSRSASDSPNIEQCSEEEKGWERGREQVNLLSELAEGVVTPAKARVSETIKYEQVLSLPKPPSLPATPLPRRKVGRPYKVVDKGPGGRTCPLCGRVLTSGKALGGHISGSHTKKMAVKSAKALQHASPSGWK